MEPGTKKQKTKQTKLCNFSTLTQPKQFKGMNDKHEITKKHALRFESKAANTSH